MRFRRYRPTPPPQGDGWPNLGHIVLDGLSFTIHHLRLEDGQVFATASARGPLRDCPPGRVGVAVFAPDGSVIISAVIETSGWAEVEAGATVTVDLPWWSTESSSQATGWPRRA